MPGALTIATTQRFALAEGPVWDAAAGLVRWVDIIGRRVLAGRLRTDGTIEVVSDADTDDDVTAVLPTLDGGIGLTVGRDAVVHGRVVARVIDDAPGRRRINDAKPDPQGRLVLGTLPYGEGDATEVLVRIEDDGTLTVLDADLRLSNGLAWSAAGDIAYSVDTAAHVVYARDYAAGVAGERRVHIALPDGELPDGICTDVDDHLWVAVWGASQVRRYAPDGTLASAIELPAARPSSVAFVGERLDLLCITSAAAGGDAVGATQAGADGALFTIDVGARGVPVSPWRVPTRREGSA